MAVNLEWHKKNPMPRSSSLYEQIAWHQIHYKQCRCRGIPEKLLNEMKRRGMSA